MLGLCMQHAEAMGSVMLMPAHACGYSEGGRVQPGAPRIYRSNPPPLPRMMAAAPAVQPSTHGSIDLPTYASLQDGGGTPGGRTPRAARRPWGQQVTLAGRVERPGGGDLSLLALHPHESGGEGLEVWSDPVAGMSMSAYLTCIHT